MNGTSKRRRDPTADNSLLELFRKKTVQVKESSSSSYNVEQSSDQWSEPWTQPTVKESLA